MPNDTKISRLILRLTKATADGEIKWEGDNPPVTMGMASDDVIPFYLEAEYKGQNIALFERRSREYDGEHDTFYWSGADSIAIIGPHPRREVIWEHQENSSALGNLIRIARESASGIDGILDDLLG